MAAPARRDGVAAAANHPSPCLPSVKEHRRPTLSPRRRSGGMADAAGLNPAAARRGGSNPSSGTSDQPGCGVPRGWGERASSPGGSSPGWATRGSAWSDGSGAAPSSTGCRSSSAFPACRSSGSVMEPMGPQDACRGQRRRNMPRFCGVLDRAACCSIPMTAWATRRIATAAGDAGRPITSGTPSFTERIISTSV